jgi:hypothetical protein
VKIVVLDTDVASRLVRGTVPLDHLAVLRTGMAAITFVTVAEMFKGAFKAAWGPSYSSIYRADDEMLVNAHVYGIGAYMAPLLHLRQLPGADLFTSYLNSFEAVWATSVPLGCLEAEAIS